MTEPAPMTEHEIQNNKKMAYEKLATDDVRVREIKPLITPLELIARLKESATSTQNILATRKAIHNILHGSDDRLLVIIGPCSIHDTNAGLEYAKRLVEVRKQLSKDLLIVMRGFSKYTRITINKSLLNCLRTSTKRLAYSRPALVS